MKIISRRGRAPNTNDTAEHLAVLQSCIDPIYYLNNYYQIEHPVQGTTNITLHSYQEEYVRTLYFNPNVIAVMPRQAGTTTITLGYLLWEAMFRVNQRIVISAVNVAQAAQLCRIMNTGVQLTPAFIRPIVKRLTRTTVEFDNGSRLIIGVNTPNFLQGTTPTRVYLDNFAHASPKLQHDTWQGLVPSLTLGCGCIIASAPNGVSDTFAQFWHGANTSNTLFTPFKKTVNDMTQFDQHWRAMMRKALGESAWRRDFECEFV